MIKYSVTIIIATYNSKSLLEKVFKAINNQTYPKDLINILAVDGGSTDDTKAFVLSNGYKIIDNPKTEPVYAKYLGYLEAKSDYVIYLDHDEVLENPKSVENKIKLFQSDEKIKAVLSSGYKTPKDISFINNYINEFGDPFSAYRYWLSKMDKFFIKRMKKNYSVINENDLGLTFELNNNIDLPIIELVAVGSMIDLKYFKDTFPETLNSPDLLPHFFYMMIENNKHLAIAKDDAIYHYSSDTFLKYLNKIKWRIKNNIFFSHLAKAGFSGRDKYEQGFNKYKKYLFIPYSFSIILPLIDSIYLIISRKKLSYAIHLPLVLYTTSHISVYMIMKLFGYKPQLTSYDASKIIEEVGKSK